MELRGIIGKAFGNFICFRGFADLKSIANISEADQDYQRPMMEAHQQELKEFLQKGENVFFPEVVLGAYLEATNKKGEFKALNIIKGQTFDYKHFQIKILSKDFVENDNFKEAKLSIYKSNQKPFFRIDGNHRLEAFIDFNENLQQYIAPFVVIFFMDKELYTKQARIIFHNINFKMIPLSMEKNLENIFKHFKSEEIKSEFGHHYDKTKEVVDKICKEQSLISNINMQDNMREAFLHLFEILKDGKAEFDLNMIVECLKDIDRLYKNNQCLRDCQNPSLFGAFMYYFIQAEETKKKFFEKWVLNNHIYKAKFLNLQSLINIFDEIYKASIRKIFVAMPFKKDYDNAWDAIVEVYNRLLKEGIELDKSLRGEDDKYLPCRIDKINGVSEDLIRKIKAKIAECDLAIVDVSEKNANVYYELGLLEANDKKIILLCQNEPKKDGVAFDISTIEHIKYSAEKLPDLKKQLHEKIKNIIHNVFMP